MVITHPKHNPTSTGKPIAPAKGFQSSGKEKTRKHKHRENHGIFGVSGTTHSTYRTTRAGGFARSGYRIIIPLFSLSEMRYLSQLNLVDISENKHEG